MSVPDAATIALLNTTIIELNRYFAVFIFFFGTIGNILNTLVLSRRILRSNPCAWLFLTSSIANIIAILSGLISRILSTWLLDLTATVGWICKLRAFILFHSRTIAFWLIALASIDRWLSSSRNVHRRQMSNLKNAQRGLFIIIFVSTLVYIHLIYCYDADQTNSPLKCYGNTLSCRLYSDLCFAFITILIPLILMMIFGLITISNIHHSQNKIQPIKSTTGKQRSLTRKTDRQLIIMLFVQIILLSVFTLPIFIQRLYITLTMNVVKSDLQNTMDNFIYNLAFLLYSVANGMPFYIYTLTGGSIFRNALSNLTQSMLRKIACNS
jgi:hypothetical protein